MPNRILKDSICVSKDILRMSWFEEVFFYRLIVDRYILESKIGRMKVLGVPIC